MSRQPLILCAFLTVLLAISTACSNDSCYENGSSLPLATFYVGDKQQSVSGLTIMGVGVPGDSLLADSATLSEIYLPLRASTTTTSYAVTRWVYQDSSTVAFHDTITITYRPVEYFHSIECGAMYNFNINTVSTTTAAIDSVVLITPLVTNALTQALRIHFTAF